MRKIEYLSPTGLKLYENDPEKFFMNYLADVRPPRDPQTQPMAIGSAFDAYVKSYLHEKLFGKSNDPKYAFQALFEAQVEQQWRDWAIQHGKYVFEQYNQAGCLADLMLELSKASSEPRFEFEIKGAINGYREGVSSEIAEVVLLGKPDVHYISSEGQSVVLDFKVNGYCSKKGPSPLSGYLRMRSAGKTMHGMHKECVPMRVGGMVINVATYMETLGITGLDWANQLSIYGWLLGEPVGSEFVVAIDQIVCDASKGVLPSIRVAEHRCRVSTSHQRKLFSRAVEVWDLSHSNHFFRDLSLEDSIAKCELLNAMTTQPIDPVFEGLVRDR